MKKGKNKVSASQLKKLFPDLSVFTEDGGRIIFIVSTHAEIEVLDKELEINDDKQLRELVKTRMLMLLEGQLDNQ